jgi:hypothetical protein
MRSADLRTGHWYVHERYPDGYQVPTRPGHRKRRYRKVWFCPTRDAEANSRSSGRRDEYPSGFIVALDTSYSSAPDHPNALYAYPGNASLVVNGWREEPAPKDVVDVGEKAARACLRHSDCAEHPEIGRACLSSRGRDRRGARYEKRSLR